MKQIVTGLVRFSHAHLFEAQDFRDGKDPKFQVSLIFDPEDPNSQVDKLKASVAEVVQQGINTKWGGKKPKSLNLIPLDGDLKDEVAYEGKLYLSAKSLDRPLVLRADGTVIDSVDRDEIKSGDYGQAIIKLYPFDAAGNKGVAAILVGVKKLRNGEALGGGSISADAAEELFASNGIGVEGESEGIL